MNFGEILQTKRKEKGLTQEDLAHQLLVSSKTISNWETNKTTPDIDNVIRISQLFDISLNHLLLEGSDMVENIKKKTSMFKNPAFIILSAVGGEQMTEESFKAGANYFIMKPFDRDILVNKIRRIGKRPSRPVIFFFFYARHN